MKNHVWIVLVALALVGCGESEVMYYRLQSRPADAREEATLCGSLRIKRFTITGVYETQYMLTSGNDNVLNSHYYDRWIQEPQDLVSDFFIDNFQTRRLFCQVTDGTGSVVLSDYVLEGRILDLLGKENGEIQLRINLSLTATSSASPAPRVVLQRVYTASAQQWVNENYASLAHAIERSLAAIADSASNDIRHACVGEVAARVVGCEGCGRER